MNNVSIRQLREEQKLQNEIESNDSISLEELRKLINETSKKIDKNRQNTKQKDELLKEFQNKYYED